MDLKERAQNISVTYRDLKEYVYVLRLLLHQVEPATIQESAVYTQFFYVEQRVGEMEFDLKYLVDNALSN